VEWIFEGEEGEGGLPLLIDTSSGFWNDNKLGVNKSEQDKEIV